MSDPKLTAKQLERILKEARAHELVDKADAMSDEEVAKRLAKAGVTEADQQAALARQRKKLEARLRADTPKGLAPEARLRADTPVKREAVRRWRPRNVIAVAFGGGVAFVAAMQLLLVSFGAMFVGVGAMPTTPIPSVTAAGAPDAGPVSAEAHELRYRALSAYTLGHYAECLQLLDQAKAIDPAGDEAMEVWAARTSALHFQPTTQDR